MAEPSTTLRIPAWVLGLRRYQSIVVPVAFMSLLAVIVVPMPALIMDMLIAANLALAAIILLTTIFVARPLDFSVFPSLLLATTLFRLVLNVATTRLILTAEAKSPQEATAVAGRVIEAFSSFVAGNSLVVGLILFIILIIVQFVVITKGATRISEVAARFTLDAMPGKQMAIDADLNAGLISEDEARTRRAEVTFEADFYGSMDGAAKFVRGDAIAGIIITLVNIIGGLAVGVFEKGWPLADALEVFTRLTIGDGLVSQLPAFVISLAAGLIVTRSSSRQDLGSELTSQLTGQWKALVVTAVFLAILAFTGLPAFPMLLLASGVGIVALLTRSGKQREQDEQDQAEADQAKSEPQSPEQMLRVDILELEVGYGLVRLVDAAQGGGLLDRITMIRRQLAAELGFVMPPVRIRDNMQLQPDGYNLKIRGQPVASGTVHPGNFLAMDSGLVSADTDLGGTPTREPAFGLSAFWIEPGQKQRAESLNYTVVDAVSVLVTHITEVVKGHAAELLTREEMNNLVEQLKEHAAKLVQEVYGGDVPLVKVAEVQKVCQNLLQERVSIRDMESITETLGDWATRTKDIEVLTEYVRNALRRSICNQYVTIEEPNAVLAQGTGDSPEGGTASLYCVSLDPALEDMVAGYIDRSEEGTTMKMPPPVANRVTTAVLQELQHLIQAGHPPVVLASPQVRGQIRRLLETHLPAVAVLGYNEISNGIAIESLGLAQLDSVNEPSISSPLQEAAR